MAEPNSAWQPGVDPTVRKHSFDGQQGIPRVFLLRLHRLTWLRRSCAGQLDDSVLKVLDKAIYSTYCDCIEQGVGEDARKVLKPAA